MKKRTKVILGSAGGLLLIVVVAAIAASAGDKGTAVRAHEVTQRDLVATVRSSGWIRPRRAVDIQADIMGRIVELRVDEGNAVSRGDLLLRIDPMQYEAAVNRAEAAVSAALARSAQVRAAQIQAEHTARRAREMAAAGTNLVSPQALEEAETQVLVQAALVDAARHDVAQARAALREAQDRLSKTVIRAPMDGVVTRRNVEEGEMAIVGTMNNPGSLLLTISDLGVMEAVVRVDETDLPHVKLGDSASVEIDAFPRRKFTGRVTRIGHSGVNLPTSPMASAAARSQAVDFEVVVTLDSPPPGLRPDLSATADIVTAIRPQVLAIPIIALTVRERPAEALPQEDAEAQAAAERAAREDVEGVFVIRDARARFTPVEVGIAGGEYFEVLSGLQLGDTVVAGPYEAIRNLADDRLVRRSDASNRRGGGI